MLPKLPLPPPEANYIRVENLIVALQEALKSYEDRGLGKSAQAEGWRMTLRWVQKHRTCIVSHD